MAFKWVRNATLEQSWRESSSEVMVGDSVPAVLLVCQSRYDD